MFDKIVKFGRRLLSGRMGIVHSLELILVVMSLFASFHLFFPRTDYRNQWEDAYVVLRSRDLMLMIDRTGNLTTYAFDLDRMEDLFDYFFEDYNLISWVEMEGAINSELRVACNCTQDVIDDLDSFSDDLKINERQINISYCSASLDIGDDCFRTSDALVVWGYRSLEPYEQIISNYVGQGKGIVEVMDFESEDQVNSDSVQTNIFGIEMIDLEEDLVEYMEFPNQPTNPDSEIYDSYKYFHRVPLKIETVDSGETIDGCGYDPAKNGTIRLRDDEYGFWICGSESVWFDTDGDLQRDELVDELNYTQLGSYDVRLNYVNDENSISISFREEYLFDDFMVFQAVPGGDYMMGHIEPTGLERERALLYGVDQDNNMRYPAVVVNYIEEGKAIWIADFSDSGFDQGEKTLMVSLILDVVRKNFKSIDAANLDIGHRTSYINVDNRDMLEIYTLSLGLGYPF